MNFWFMELHSDRRVLPIGKMLSWNENEGTVRYVLGFSYEDGLKLHVIENCREMESKLEETHRDAEKSHLLNLSSRLEKVMIGENEYLSHSSQSSPMWEGSDISLFYEFMREGWIAPEELKYTDWRSLGLYSYNIECGKIPEVDGEIELVYHTDPKCSFVEWEFPLKIGEPRDISLENIPCYINNSYLLDIYDDIEKIYSDPRAREMYSEEQIADMKEKAIETMGEHCPRDMRYVVIEYECDEDISFHFDFPERLNKKIGVASGNSTSVSVVMITQKPDKERGTHGMPLKAAVLQAPVAQNTTEVSVELFYISIRTSTRC